MATPSPSPGPSPSAVPSIDELMEEAKKIPSLEELEAAAQGVEPAAAQPAMPPEFSGEELAAGAFRAALGGATAGLAEPAYFMPLDAVMGAIASYARNSEFDKAKGLIERMQEGVAQGYQKQKAIESQYPITSQTLEMAAGAIPAVGPAKIGATAAEKAIRTGLRAVPEFGAGALKAEKPLGVLAELGAAGAKGGLAMASGEEVERGAAEAAGVKGAQGTAGEIAGRVATATGAGAVLTPAMGIGMVGGLALEAKLKDALLSKEAKNLVRLFFGTPIKTQEQYLKDPKAIDDLPGRAEIDKVFEEVLQFSKEELTGSKEELDFFDAKEKQAKEAIDKAIKVTKGAWRDKLVEYRDQLDRIKARISEQRGITAENLAARKLKIREQQIAPLEEKAEKTSKQFNFEKEMALRGAQETAEQEVATLRSGSQSPYASEFVEFVRDAVKEVKKQSGEASLRAIETLQDGEFVPISVFEEAIQKQINKTQRIIGLSSENEALRRYLFKMKEKVAKTEIRNLPPTEVKKELQDIQRLLGSRDKTRYSEPEEDALAGIAEHLNKYLKDTYEGYRERMIPTSEMTAFVKDFANTEFSTRGKIESALYASADDPVMRQRFQELERHSGIPVFERLALFHRQLEASKSESINKAIRDLPGVRALRQLREDLKNTQDPRAQARIRQQIPFAEEAARAELEVERAKDPANIRALEEQLPEMKQLKQLEAALDIAQSADFEQSVARTVADPEAAKVIIGLRHAIANLKNKKRLEAHVAKKTFMQSQDLGSAALSAKEAGDRYDKARASFDPIKNYESGENIVQSILRNADGPATDQSLRILKGLSDMDPDKLVQFFGQLGVNNPKELGKLAEALRIRRSIETERIRGSRGVQLYTRVMTSVVNALGMVDPTTKGLSQAGKTIANLAGFVGAAMDIGGGEMAKIYLRNVASMNGVFSFEKLIKKVPEAKRMAVPISEFVSHLADESRKVAVSEVSQANRQSVIDDIKASSLSPIKKARASLQVANGFIEGDLLADLLESGMPKSSEKPLAARMVGFTQ